MSITPTNAVYQYTKAVGTIAYIYAYPLVKQWIQMTNDVLDKAPINVMHYSNNLSTPSNGPFPGTNVDTLYATAWIDLSNTEIFLSLPDTGNTNRWFTVQLLDAYTNTFKNLPGIYKNTQVKKYYLVGPNNELNFNVAYVPDDVKIIRCPTNIVYLVSRTEVKGNADLTDAIQVMENITIEVTNSEATVIEVNRLTNSVLTSLSFFDTMIEIMNYNAPLTTEKVIIDQFKTIGLDPIDNSFNSATLNTNLQNAFNAAISLALDYIIPFGYQYTTGSVSSNNWVGSTKIGTYNDEYLRRAYTAFGGIAANIPFEQNYLSTTKTGSGATLNCSTNNYKIHFEANALPKVNAMWGFWSITLYQFNSGIALYDNELDRYALGTNTDILQFNIDGSLDIYIQHDSPSSELISNWLPAPAAPFLLMIRMYSATMEQIYNPNLPAVELNNV